MSHDLSIAAQLEPNDRHGDAGVSVGFARMVITCSDCIEHVVLPPNVRSIAGLAAMQEYHHAEHTPLRPGARVRVHQDWEGEIVKVADDPHDPIPYRVRGIDRDVDSYFSAAELVPF